MTQSPEYPDLLWMPPRAFGAGRDGKAVRLIVVHYTAGAERNTSAEDGARYDKERRDGTSTHYFVDSDSVVQCVRTGDRGNAARTKGNRLGIQYELCGTVQTRAQWLDQQSLPTLRNAAKQVARDCKKYGIPPVRLSVAETRRAWTEFPNGPKGIVGHVDCTAAFPEDGGDHTDPGTGFPWDVFLGLVQTELEDENMPTAKEIADAVWAKDLPSPWLKVTTRPASDWLKYADACRRDVQTMGAALGASLQVLAARDAFDEEAFAATLAPAIASLVLTELASGGDQVTQEEVTQAVQAAFAQAFATKG